MIIMTETREIDNPMPTIPGQIMRFIMTDQAFAMTDQAQYLQLIHSHVE